MTDAQPEQTIPTVESIVDPDQDVDDKIEVPEEEEVWPPPNWRDEFKVPANYLVAMVNVVPYVLTELEHDNDEAAKYAAAAGTKVPIVFFSHDKKKTDFKDGEWDPKDWRLHPAPDLPGLAKGIYIHASTLSQIQEIKRVYPVVGLMWHPVPHRQSRDIFVIQEIYIMPGATINSSLIGDKPCSFCTKGATRSCYGCDSVLFCSQPCADMAEQSGAHTAVDCRMALRKRVESDAIRARERIIAKHAEVESDRVKRAERLKAQDEKKVANDTHKEKKRARLRYESALARKQMGMEPSRHLANEDAAIAAAAAAPNSQQSQQ